jgi:hypothetical protein
MKKLLLAFALTTILASCALAQSTKPRFGITKNDDNTGRILTFALITTTDAAQAALDTVVISPRSWETIVRPSANIQDSVCYKIPTAGSYSLGDIVEFMVAKGTGAGKIKIFGSNVVLSGTTIAIALAANKMAVIRLRWNGTKWIEEFRMVQS